VTPPPFTTGDNLTFATGGNPTKHHPPLPPVTPRKIDPLHPKHPKAKTPKTKQPLSLIIVWLKTYRKKGFIIKKSITFRVDEELVKAFSEAVKKTGVKKTFVIEECLKKYIKKTGGK